MKTCTKCNISKNLSNFTKDKRRIDGLRTQCNFCRNEYLKLWNLKNPEKSRNAKYKNRYKISVEDYNKMLKSQNYKCAICLSASPKVGQHFTVDHCHFSGQVRQLLCRNCNTAIGLLEENTEILQNCINYLKKFKLMKAA